MEAENSYNTPKKEISAALLDYYEYRDKFNKELCILLSKPILSELKQRKQNLVAFSNELKKSGLNYSYVSLCNALRGNNKYVVNFNYFSSLYHYLKLPFPSLQYLSSFD